MASISTDSSGNRTIQFVAGDGKRRSLRLGKMSLRNVEALKVKVEALNIAVISGNSLVAEVAVWLTNRDAVLTDKLAAVGLIPKREAATLEKFLATYIAKRIDIKPPNHCFS